ncbi:ADP-ribosylglycohydrolase family protein [Solibacillus sp. FSL H8-0538]|uniref:ADP-ribosylglycohydrolase family protein n=1 Tax=Solibacillus sp. FSL H8-0538 TaxID=2921400 RepID=UPI0030F4B677
MDQLRAAIFGFCVGDALGVPVEFEERDTFQITEMVGYRSWNVPAGSWSDDSAMMFCTMEHFVEQSDLDALKEKFCDWRYRGYWTHDNEPTFDIGITISEVIQRWEFYGYLEKACDIEQSNGNGALMRILPLAFEVKKRGLVGDDLFDFVKSYATLTHGHIRSTLACAHYIYVARGLLEGDGFIVAFNRANAMLQQKLLAYPKEGKHFFRFANLQNTSRESIHSSGYVIDTIEAVYWSLLHTKSYEEAVLKGIHLGNDTDTIGALIGGLAGIMYGYNSIPERWLNELAKGEGIEDLIRRFE